MEAQIAALEKAKSSGQFNSAQEVLDSHGLNYEVDGNGVSSHNLANSDGAAYVEADSVVEGKSKLLPF